ncbi:E2F transcription factor-like E2FE [Curcuma longa]|uniref:E2F transcription factor-like E2FE n=1 Tax=Curcuma longa TaxID=136217 RepID=UPI003D9E8075
MSSSCPSHLVDATGVRHHAYSRKQKSLGLLCTNFVSLYNREGVESISLDDAARRLGVERRRIYDIVNILAKVGLLSKNGKNACSWIGFSGISKALERLEEEARRGISCHKGICAKDDSDDESLDQYVDDGDENQAQTVSTTLSTAPFDKTISAKVNRRAKSLGTLTENFIKLFLTSDGDTISLDAAARLLLGATTDASYMRTKVRRLYDIANVLSSIFLIEKTQLEARKPAFRWLGAKGKKEPSDAVTVAISSSPKKLNKRTFGTELTNVGLKKNKLNSAEGKKPMDHKMRSENLQEHSFIPQQQSTSKNGYSFGPFHPVGVMKQTANSEVKSGKGIQQWENLAASFRPMYQNQALSELFSHYLEAWDSWYAEATKGRNVQQQFNKLVKKELL